MGHRANLIVVEDGDVEVYADRWLGRMLDEVLFWGPAPATRVSREGDEGVWLTDRWAEAACVIDHDARVLLWYGGEWTSHSPEVRGPLIRFMTRTHWQGWTVRWAYDGLLDIARYVNEPAQTVLDPDLWRDPRGFSLQEDPSHGGMLLSVAADSRITWTVVGGGSEALCKGASQLDTLLAFPRGQARWQSAEPPAGGLHLDLEARTLGYWFCGPVENIERRMAQSWPDWTGTWWREGLDVHAALLPGLEPPRVRDETVLRKYLRRLLREVSNDVLRMGSFVWPRPPKHLRMQRLARGLEQQAWLEAQLAALDADPSHAR